MKLFRYILPALLSVMAGQQAAAHAFRVDGLKCENLEAPLAIDNVKPHFSWLNHAQYNNARQAAF